MCRTIHICKQLLLQMCRSGPCLQWTLLQEAAQAFSTRQALKNHKACFIDIVQRLSHAHACNALTLHSSPGCALPGGPCACWAASAYCQPWRLIDLTACCMSLKAKHEPSVSYFACPKIASTAAPSGCPQSPPTGYAAALSCLVSDLCAATELRLCRAAACVCISSRARPSCMHMALGQVVRRESSAQQRSLLSHA